MLYDLCENIVSRDLSTLKFACNDHISASENEKIKFAEDLMLALLRKSLIHPNDLQYLKQLLSSLENMNLMHIIETYEGNWHLISNY